LLFLRQLLYLIFDAPTSKQLRIIVFVNTGGNCYQDIRWQPTSEECSCDAAIIPGTFKLSEIGFCEQITRLATKYRIPFLVLSVNEWSRKDKTTFSERRWNQSMR
jgi:hypothetical protein